MSPSSFTLSNNYFVRKVGMLDSILQSLSGMVASSSDIVSSTTFSLFHNSAIPSTHLSGPLHKRNSSFFVSWTQNFFVQSLQLTIFFLLFPYALTWVCFFFVRLYPKCFHGLASYNTKSSLRGERFVPCNPFFFWLFRAS